VSIESNLPQEGQLPTLEPMLQKAQQVVACLLQQDIVVPFIRAVRIVVIPEVPQSVHCKEATSASLQTLIRETCPPITHNTQPARPA
jgi:hypothetical protein